MKEPAFFYTDSDGDVHTYKVESDQLIHICKPSNENHEAWIRTDVAQTLLSQLHLAMQELNRLGASKEVQDKIKIRGYKAHD